MTLLKHLSTFATASLFVFAEQINAQEIPEVPTPAPQKQYDFLIGSWSCTYLQYSNDKESKGQLAAQYPCDWNARYTFDGNMVQDDFRMYYQDKMVFAGTTLRTWVEKKQRWDLAFLAARVGHWPNFHGTWQENGMEIAASGSDGRGDFISKIRFTDITANSFLWEMEKSYDQGSTWDLDAQIKTTRQTQLP